MAHALIAHARVHPDDLAIVAELIGFTGAANAADDLLAWSSHADPQVRAAALQALGSLGLDDRAYYYVLRALGDTSDAVRAMAARALGRSRRSDAAPYLAQHLGDEWLVAAHAATALRMLGPSGERELAARQDTPVWPGCWPARCCGNGGRGPRAEARHEGARPLGTARVRAARAALLLRHQHLVPAVLGARLLPLRQHRHRWTARELEAVMRSPATPGVA